MYGRASNAAGSRSGRRWVPALVALACVAQVRVAAADTSPSDQAAAQALFDEGRKLMAAEDYAHACPKFAESERLDPGGGTLLNLALCHEAEGKTASAWTEFNESLSRAIHDGRPEREARARERIAALAPKLSRLTVSVAAGAPADLQITVDGSTWSPAMLGVAVPVDPGPHVITARASSRRPWSTTITVRRDADAESVLVPVLESSEGPATPGPPSPASEATPGTAHPLRTAAWIAGGVGLAGVAVGAVFGVLAVGQWNQQKSDCGSAATCTSRPDALSAHSAVVTDGAVSTVGFIAGGALIGAAVVVLLTTPGGEPSPSSSVAVVPALGPSGATLGLQGAF